MKTASHTQETWTAAEYQAFLKTKQKPNKGNKYGAVRAEYNGRNYDSTGEAEYSAHLDMLKKAGEIKRIQYQYKIPLESGGEFVCFYVADFRLTMSDGSIVICDFKGMETDLFKQKWQMLKNQLSEIEPNAEMWLVKKVDGKFQTVEIFPQTSTI